MKYSPYTGGNPLIIGATQDGAPIRLSPDDRSRHLYVPGATRAGKSKFLENLIRQDIKNWRKSKSAVVVLDPHGRLHDDLVSWLTWNERYLPKDLPVILIDPRQDWIVGYNALRERSAATSVTVSGLVSAVAHAFGQGDTVETPLFGRQAQNIFWALYELRLTLVEARYFTEVSESGMRGRLVAMLKTPEVRAHWESAAQVTPERFAEMLSSTLNRLRPFVSNDLLKCMFGQRDHTLDWRKVLDDGAIVLCNLSLEGGHLSAEDQAVLGSTIMHDLWLAAQERGKKGGAAYVYLDEFQEFISPSLAQQLDQASGFGLHLTLAHQYPTQLLNKEMNGKAAYDSVLANVQNKAVFHTEHPTDLETLALMLFMSTFSAKKILHELYSTKIVGYREEVRTSEHESVAETDGGALDEGHISGSASGTALFVDADGNTLATETDTEHSGQSNRRSRSWSTSKTKGVSHTPVQIPVFGKELSSVQFESKEWQLHSAMMALRDQKQRQFVAKVHSQQSPLTLTTETVKPTPAWADGIAKYIARVKSRLPFALSIPEAQQRIAERQAELKALSSYSAEEPQTARRVRKRPPKAAQ